MVTKIFISHASGDTWVALQIVGHIRARHADTFLDEGDIHKGDDFRDRILAAEPACSELLVLLTPWSIKRPWVLFEISIFVHSRKRIVGILHGMTVDEAMQDPMIGTLLARRDLVDINRIDTYLEELSNRVRASSGGETNG